MGEVADSKCTGEMHPLGCLLFGTLDLGMHQGLTDDRMELAEAFMETRYQVYYQFKMGLKPETVYFNITPYC